MADAHLPFGIPESELQLSFSRSSGPGGQNVNKTSSKATLHWDALHSPSLPEDVRERFVRAYASRLTRAGQIVLYAQRHRDQSRNAADVVAKLAEMLRAVERPRRKRKPTRPGRGAIERRIAEKKHRGRAKRERRGPRDAD